MSSSLFQFHEKLSSTQDEAFRVAEENSSEHIWIIADTQEQGRGRQGRSWQSLPGNLLASFMLHEPCEQVHVSQLSFVAGIALHEAVSYLVQTSKPLCLKWPNDLLLNGAKLAGLLVETRFVRSQLVAVIGFGVNTAHAPADMPYPCASLELSKGEGRDQCLSRLHEALQSCLTLWNKGNNFPAIRALWLERALPLSTPFRVTRSDQIYEGAFAGIDEQGRLQLQIGDRLHILDSGDAFPVPVS